MIAINSEHLPFWCNSSNNNVDKNELGYKNGAWSVNLTTPKTLNFIPGNTNVKFLNQKKCTVGVFVQISKLGMSLLFTKKLTIPQNEI